MTHAKLVVYICLLSGLSILEVSIIAKTAEIKMCFYQKARRCKFERTR